MLEGKSVARQHAAAVQFRAAAISKVPAEIGPQTPDPADSGRFPRTRTHEPIGKSGAEQPLSV
jgi:hypothetical protein